MVERKEIEAEIYYLEDLIKNPHAGPYKLYLMGCQDALKWTIDQNDNLDEKFRELDEAIATVNKWGDYIFGK